MVQPHTHLMQSKRRDLTVKLAHGARLGGAVQLMPRSTCQPGNCGHPHLAQNLRVNGEA